jgi:hypothetical protein
VFGIDKILPFCWQCGAQASHRQRAKTLYGSLNSAKMAGLTAPENKESETGDRMLVLSITLVRRTAQSPFPAQAQARRRRFVKFSYSVSENQKGRP